MITRGLTSGYVDSILKDAWCGHPLLVAAKIQDRRNYSDRREVFDREPPGTGALRQSCRRDPDGDRGRGRR